MMNYNSIECNFIDNCIESHAQNNSRVLTNNLHKVLPYRPMDRLDKGKESEDISNFYGPIQAEKHVFIPTGEVKHARGSLDRKGIAYETHNVAVGGAVFSIIEGLKFVADFAENQGIISKFKDALTKQKFTDLAIQAYVKFQHKPEQLKLAITQIFWLYIHDDARDDKDAPLHNNAAMVTKMNEELIAYIKQSGQHGPFSFSEGFMADAGFNSPANKKYKLNITLVEGITTAYKAQLDELLKLEDGASEDEVNVHQEMRRKLVSNILVYFSANYTEALDAGKTACTLSNYQSRRIDNSAVPLCAALGEVFIALNHENPVYAWFEINDLHNPLHKYKELHDTMALHVGGVNCIFSAVREFLNGDSVNLVLIFRQQSATKSFHEGFALATDFVNHQYERLEDWNNQLEAQRIAAIRAARACHNPMSVAARLAIIEGKIEKLSHKDSQEKHQDSHKKEYRALIFEKSVLNFFQDKELTVENIKEFLESDPKSENFGFIFDWSDANYHFSKLAPRYAALDQRMKKEGTPLTETDKTRIFERLAELKIKKLGMLSPENMATIDSEIKSWEDYLKGEDVDIPSRNGYPPALAAVLAGVVLIGVVTFFPHIITKAFD